MQRAFFKNTLLYCALSWLSAQCALYRADLNTRFRSVMWYFSAPNGHRSVLFSAISVCDWAMDPGGESCPEWHIPEAHSCPLVVLWCWSRRGVRHLPDCGGAVRSDWVRVYKNVLFACCHSVAPVWKQKKNQTTLLMWTLFFNMFHVYKYRFVKCLEPEQSFGLKRPQHKWSLECLVALS